MRQQVIVLLHGRAATGARHRVGRRESARLIDDAHARLGPVEERLAAVERWVGLAPDLDDLDHEITHVRHQKVAAVDSQDFETAAALRDKERELLARKVSKEQEWAATTADRTSLVAELGQANAELERLRAVLRQHGLESGDATA